MGHGTYIAEFEEHAARRGYRIGHRSLGELLLEVDFSKLGKFAPDARQEFYETMIMSLRPNGRHVENGVEIWSENDAKSVVDNMKKLAINRSFRANWIRDIWCMVYVGGCP